MNELPLAKVETIPPVRKTMLQSMRVKVTRNWDLYVLIALPMAFLIVFNYLPMAGAQIAFRDYSPVQGIWRSPWIGWQEFSMLIQSPFFLPIIKNTLLISLYGIGVITPVTVILALLLNEVRHHWFKRIVQTVTYFPYFISTVVIVGMINLLLSSSGGGLYAEIAGIFGFQNPPDILSSPTAFYSIYVWSDVWQGAGYGAVIYLAALANVNPELYEAAKLDGASIIQKIRHIDWQAIKPTIVVMLILSVANLLGVGFEKAYLLQNNLNLSASEIISTYTYKIGLLDANFSFSGAVGLFNSVVNMVLLIAVNFVSRRVSGTSLF